MSLFIKAPILTNIQDKSNLKEMVPCAKICMEVNLEKCFLEAIEITLDKWNHL